MQIVGSVTKVISGISKEEVFAFWADVDNWAKWNDDIYKAELHSTFEVGNFFTLFLKSGQKVKIKLIEVKHNKSFTDCTSFPLAKMYGSHEIDEKDGTLTLKATIKIEGLLSFVWTKLVAQSVANSLSQDMEKMIGLIQDAKK